MNAPPPVEFKRVLIVKTSSLGDILHTFPAVHAFARAFPAAQIDWLANEEYVPLVQAHPDVRNVLPYPRKALSSPLTCLPAIVRTIRAVRREKYDLVLDFHGIVRASFFTWCTRCKTRMGFYRTPDHISDLFYTHAFKLDPSIKHAIDLNSQLVKRAFELPDTFDLLRWPELELTPEACAKAKQLLQAHADVPLTLAVVPGARWASKCFSVDFYAEIMREISKKLPTRFVIIGGPSDTAKGDRILTQIGTLPVLNLCGKTDTMTLLALLRRCDALVSSDTGPLHAAVALNIPTFSFFAPNDPAHSGPRGQVHHFIYHPEIDCSPCMKRRCPKCSAAQTPPCHALIRAGDVAEDFIRYFTKEKKS